MVFVEVAAESAVVIRNLAAAAVLPVVEGRRMAGSRPGIAVWLVLSLVRTVCFC